MPSRKVDSVIASPTRRLVPAPKVDWSEKCPYSPLNNYIKRITQLIVIAIALLLFFLPKTAVAEPPPETISQGVLITKVPLTPKEKIEQEFKDAPVMVKIAGAESTHCKNKVNPKSSARGCFQILKGTWRDYKCEGDFNDEAVRMDDDKNIACARKLYDRDGTVPWNESKANWSK